MVSRTIGGGAAEGYVFVRRNRSVRKVDFIVAVFQTNYALMNCGEFGDINL